MPTLIGISDALFDEQKHCPSYYTNKIGGLPAWPSSDINVTARCSVCDGELSLVVQLYCPLEGSKYHRTLYVFGCSNPPCWNNSDSWVAFRCQIFDDSSINTVKSDTAATGTNDDDDDDWGTGGDDWGVDADDWGEPEPDPTYTDIPEEDNDVPITETAECTDKITTTTSENPGNVAQEVDSVADSLNMQQMCIDDVDNDEDGSITPNSHIIAEELASCLNEQSLASVKAISETEDRPSDMKKVLNSYFIDVFDEPTNQNQDDGHVTQLLRNYQQQEGIQSLKESLSSKDGGAQGGGGGEKYERAMLVHKDAVFHKFTKRLTVCPEQCVRYEWNGTPLYMRPTTPNDIPTLCIHCQGQLVFEVQLMPALVNLLKFPGFTGTPIEFGTVIVYTCKQSCWEATTKYRTEKVIVQADPDQDRFRV